MSSTDRKSLWNVEDIDEKILEEKIWAQELLNRCTVITKKAVASWCHIVRKIGETEIDIERFISIFVEAIERQYKDLVDDVDAIHDKCIFKIENLLQQIQNLCYDLHLEIPTMNYENETLGDIKKVLLERVADYEYTANERRKELSDLNQKQVRLCNSLGKEPQVLAQSPLPFPQEIEDLRAKIEMMENEALEREEKFFQMREEIMDIVQELEVEPNLDFEKEILGLPNTEVKIADADMEQLQMFLDRLKKQSENVKEEMTELRGKVDDLWDKLEIDIAERDSFRQNNTGNSMHTLAALKAEVLKLEDMKKINIKGFIEKQRKELAELWEKCHCTIPQSNEFQFYKSELYNEDLFELHDLEIKKWKTFYQENIEIFNLLQEYTKIWQERLDLERNAGGANRYKNRGGQLLTEEKRRNKFKKQIPRIEENLMKMAETYRLNKGKPLLTFGQTIEDYIAKLHEDRDREFQLKLSAQKQKREQEPVAGRSRMNLFPAASSTRIRTPGSNASKRKLMATPTTEPVKKRRSASHAKTCPKSGMPKLNVSKVRSKHRRHRLSFSRKENDKENHNDTGSTTYNDFAKEISSRNEWRSTTFVLREQQNRCQVPTTPVQSEFLIPKVTLTTPSARREHLLTTPRPQRTPSRIRLQK